MILYGSDVEPGPMLSVSGYWWKEKPGRVESIELLAEGEMIRLAVEPLLSNAMFYVGVGTRLEMIVYHFAKRLLLV